MSHINLEDSRARRQRHSSLFYSSAESILVGAHRIAKDGPTYHFLNPNGAVRQVFLPPIEPGGGQFYIVSNTGTTGSLQILTNEGIAVPGGVISTGVTVLAISSASSWFVLSLSPTAGGGAPVSAEYLTKSADISLTAERVVTDGISVTFDWSIGGQVKAVRAALTGDVTASIDNNATTIVSNAVTNSKLADMVAPAFKGRVTAGTGDPEDLTGTQATAMLDTFTSSLKGLAPSSGGGTANFLRADGLWVAPPGSTTTLAVGTTPITAGATGNYLYDNAGILGERTPTQATATLDLFTATLKGLVPGSGGGSSTFLRSDGTWQTPAGAGNVSNSGTPVAGQWARWVTATTIEGINAAATDFVQKSGDTMTGNLSIVKSAPVLALDATGTDDSGVLVFNNGGSVRWVAGMSGSAEAGGNAGSNFIIQRYTDGGALIDAPLTVARNNGQLTLLSALNLPSDPTSALQAATKQYVDNGIAVAIPACGRLTYVSTTQIRFVPYNGNVIRIAGATYFIPSAGVTATYNNCFINGVGGQTLAGSVLYYIYMFNNAGTLTIDFSPTGHVASSSALNVGTEIKSGDDSRTLIGMVLTDGGGQFVNSPAVRWIVSWFNRRNIEAKASGTASATTTSTTPIEIGGVAYRAYFVTWAEEAVAVSVSGYSQNSGAGNYQTLGIYRDGGPAELLTVTSLAQCFTANAFVSHAGTAYVTLSEGLHWISPNGNVNAGTGTYNVAVSAMIRG